MDLKERTNDRRRTFMKDRLEHKLDDVIRDKARLEEANDLLKAELERDERERDQMWSALEKGLRPQRSRLRRVLLLGVGVSAAYVAGSKAGRARYEEITGWWDRMRGRATELQSEAQRAVTAKAERLTGQAQAAADDLATGVERTTATTGAKIEAGGQKAANTMRSTTRDATS
jgi:hypothetical protein